MALNAKLKPSEILAVAIRSEIAAADFYAKILSRVKNVLLQQKLKFLVLEEKRHRKILERLYSERFPDVPFRVPPEAARPPLPTKADKKIAVLELFKTALKAEKDSETFYRQAGRTAEDTGSRKILEYLTRVERSHYFLIKSEIDLLSRFPDYYNVEDFHLGQDLFHVGP
jgi:rubrerythrin